MREVLSSGIHGIRSLIIMNITVKDLLDAGVHFGHQVRRWNPRSKQFVFDHRHGISIIDLEKTHRQLELACEFLQNLVADGGDILFVGTKKQAQDLIRETATTVNMPFCANRWMGGTLTNFTTIKQSLEKYRKYLKMEADGGLDKLYKKEASAIRREMDRMYRNFEGLKEIGKLPAAMFVIDTKNEQIAVAEARRLHIPVVALVDTNSDPTIIDYPIPGNDDAVKSIRLILETVLEAVQNGLAAREQQVAAQKAMKPIVRQDFVDVEPEVTIAADINIDGDEKKKDAAAQAPAPEAAPEAAEKPAEEDKS